MFIKFNSKYHQRMYALKIVRFNEQNHDESDPALTFRELYPQITLPNCNVNEKRMTNTSIKLKERIPLY